MSDGEVKPVTQTRAHEDGEDGTRGRSGPEDTASGIFCERTRRMRGPDDPRSPETLYREALRSFVSFPSASPVVASSTTPYRTSSYRSAWDPSTTRSRRLLWDHDQRAGKTAVEAPFNDPRGVVSPPPLLLQPSGWGLDTGGEWTPLAGKRAVRGVWPMPLSGADSRGFTMLHLAAQHNDVGLLKELVACEGRRQVALRVRNERKARVQARARDWAKRAAAGEGRTTQAAAAAGGGGAATATGTGSGPVPLSSKELRRRLKEQQVAEERLARTMDVASGAIPVGASGERDPDEEDDSRREAQFVEACRSWLPLDPDEGAHGPGSAIMQRLRGMLDEAQLRKVVRLGGMYCLGRVNEADWYHRTEAILLDFDPADLLVAIAEAHPCDTSQARAAKEAIKDYAEDACSVGAGGSYWRETGIEDALDFNMRNHFGETPLMVAVQRNSLECIAGLLEHEGTDIEAANNEGCTALIAAALLDKEDAAKIIIGACRRRRVGVNQQTVKGYSALHWAAVRDNTSLAVDLIDAGASVNEGRTARAQALWRLPIHKCAEYGSTACLKVLLEAGADVLAEDGQGMAPMHIAAGKGFTDMMLVLSSARGTTSGEPEPAAAAGMMNVVSKKNGRIPLHHAVESLQSAAARLILDSSTAADGAQDARHLLDAAQRTKLELLLVAAEKEERGLIAWAADTLGEFARRLL